MTQHQQHHHHHHSPPTREGSHTSLSTIASALSWGLSALTKSTGNSSKHATGSTNTSSTSTPSSSRPRTPYSPPPLAPLKLTGYAPTTSSRLLSRSLAEEIRVLMPARLQLHDTWTLAYSLEQHGVCLSTLYGKTAAKPRSAYVLVVKDTDGRIFGGFVSEGFKPSGGRFYGTGECFLWKSDGGGGEKRFKAFPCSGVNDYVILCEPGFLSMGGGDGRYGLWLDDRFETGVSQTSLTFGNEPLTDGKGGKFDVLDVELWRVGQ